MQAPVRRTAFRRALPPTSLPPEPCTLLVPAGGAGRVALRAVLPTSLRSMDRPSLLRRFNPSMRRPVSVHRAAEMSRAARGAEPIRRIAQDDSRATHAICTRIMCVNRIRTCTRAKCASSFIAMIGVACASRFSRRALRVALRIRVVPRCANVSCRSAIAARWWQRDAPWRASRTATRRAASRAPACRQPRAASGTTARSATPV